MAVTESRKTLASERTVHCHEEQAMEGIQLKTVLGFVLLLASVGFGRQLDLGQIFGGNVHDAEDAMEIMRILGKPRTVSPVSPQALL